MKYVGKESLSSTTYIILLFAWWGLIISAAIGIGVFVWTRFADLPNSEILQIKTSGLIFEFKPQPNINYNWILPSVLTFIPSYGLMLYVVYQLKSVLKSLMDGNPFNRNNSKRISYIGVALVAKTLLQIIPITIATQNIAKSISVPGVTVHPRLWIDFNTLAVGIMVIILGEIFRMGTKIKEENDLVI